MASAEVSEATRIGRDEFILELARSLSEFLEQNAGEIARPVAFSISLFYGGHKPGKFDVVTTHRYDFDQRGALDDALPNFISRSFANLALEFAGGLIPQKSGLH